MIENLIRKHLKQFQPYRSARSEVSNAEIFLDANELALGSPVSLDGISLNRYPDPYQTLLRERLASRFSVPSAMLFVGVGSDEIIDLLIRLFCTPSNDSIAVLVPTYGVYRVAADVNDVEVNSIRLNNEFHIDLEETLRSVSSSTKIIFCCSPNNPTGNLLRREDILKLCRNVKGIVVVDQAYVEFAETSGNLVAEVQHYDNLIVLKTLSKAWGLAGIRLGYCVANPLIVSYLLRIKSPYNVNAVTSRLALKGIENNNFLHESVSRIMRERERLTAELKKSKNIVRVYPSDANFILAEFKDARRIYEGLSESGIIVRRRSEPRLQNCLRITVGTKKENDLLLKAMGELT